MTTKNILSLLSLLALVGAIIPGQVLALVNIGVEAEVKATTAPLKANVNTSVQVTSTTSDSETSSEESMVKIITNVNEIESESDLRAYAAGRLNADEKIETIDFTQTSVQVSYQDEARLWGFIPVTVTIKSEVDQDGKIKIDYPWYWFMVSHQSSGDLEAALTAAVQTDTESTWDVKHQAELATKLEAALKANLN